MSIAGYINPFLGASGITAERIDQGQDFALKPGDPIFAIGRAKVLGVQPDWYQGQPFVYYELLEGPRKGQVIYDAEQITPKVKAGDVVPFGGLIGTYAASGTGLETGFGTRSGATLAGATTGYVEGQVTPAGQQFSSFLRELGVSTGQGSKSTGTTTGGKGPIGAALGLVGEAGKAADNLAGEAAGAVGKEAAKGIVDLVKPVATKLTLYAVFIFGAIAMLVFGLQELLKPVGGPDLVRDGKRALAGATVAAAAA